MHASPLLRFLVVLLPVVLLGACSSVNSALGGNSEKQAKAEVSWDFGREAIQIELASDDALNTRNDEAHTLVLGVFQLEDDKPFLALLGDSNALKTALINGKAEGVKQLDRYVVSPGKRTVLALDRYQDVRYVGLVAGYYDFNAIKDSRLFRIPLNMTRQGWVSRTYEAQPAHLALRLQLGRNAIVNAQSLTFDADQKPHTESVPLDPKSLEITLTDQAVHAAETSGGAARKLRN